VVEGDVHRPGVSTGCQEPSGLAGRLVRRVTTSATATAAAAARTAALSIGFMAPERSDLGAFMAHRMGESSRFPGC
jgi:hypothetical protein